MPDNASQAGRSAAASDAGTAVAQAAEAPPSLARHHDRQLIQFGATQHYNNYPVNSGQQMTWAYDPRQGPPWAPQVNGSVFPYPVSWGQQEEAVTSFAVGSYQGHHGFSVSLKPETFLNLPPDQQAAFINLGRSNNLLASVTPVAPPQVPDSPKAVIEEAAPEATSEPPAPATEEPKSKCIECDRQLMINIHPYQCNSVPLCGSCYHVALRRYSVFDAHGHAY